MIRFHCLECGMLIQANDSAVGRAAKCPGCGAVLEIPQASFPAPPPPPKTVPAAPPVAVPPVAPPPAPEMAARSGGDALSLDELLGSSTVAAPPVSNAAVGSMPDADFLSAARVGGKTGSAAGKRTGSKASAATKPGKAVKHGKATAPGGAIPAQKIRNFSIAAIAAGARLGAVCRSVCGAGHRRDRRGGWALLRFLGLGATQFADGIGARRHCARRCRGRIRGILDIPWRLVNDRRRQYSRRGA